MTTKAAIALEKVKTTFDTYEGTEPYLFISYSHADTDRVFRILNRLDKEKFRMWYDDTMEVGEDFRVELKEKIENCAAFLIFISEASMTSKYCGMEIITAFKNNKKIFPIYIEDEVEIPAALKMMLENLQHVKGVSLEHEEKYISKMISGLPVEAMRSLIMDKGVLKKCKDGSKFVNIPETVTIIDSEAFKECETLEEVNFSEALEVIRDEAFRGCKGVKSLNIPVKVKTIGESSFRDCTGLKDVVILNDDIEIGERAFENCQGLQNVFLPQGLTEIYGGVFNSCKSIKSLELPEKLTIIGESSFSDCINLKKIKIPNEVTKIDDMVFGGCANIEEILLPEGLNKIGKNAFKDCRSLSKIHIPSTVYNIGSGPFRGCERLCAISVEAKSRYFKSVNDILFNKNKSTLICYPAKKDKYEYEIPDSVTVIADWAFCECTKLSKVVIPDSVNEIGEGAFYKCTSLKSLTIPDSVVKIEDTAFRGCSNLENIIIPKTVKEFGWGLFNGCENIVVHCHQDSKAAKYCDKKNIKYCIID